MVVTTYYYYHLILKKGYLPINVFIPFFEVIIIIIIITSKELKYTLMYGAGSTHSSSYYTKKWRQEDCKVVNSFFINSSDMDLY